MNFTTYKLTPALSRYAESIFHYDSLVPDHRIERVVPTGHVFIIWELDNQVRHTYDNDSLEIKDSFSNIWISGVHKNYLSISAVQNAEMLVVQLRPQGAYPVLQRSVDELNDQVVGAQHIFGKEVLSLRQRIINTNTAEDKLELVANWLSEKIDLTKAPDMELDALLNKLKEQSYNQHKEIVSSYSKTQKHLIDQFKKHFGLTPKTMHRVYRFNLLLQEIHNKKSISWSDIAYQFGYSDQSHFIKEFKAFSGFSPKDFIKSNFHNDQPNFFPLDREG